MPETFLPAEAVSDTAETLAYDAWTVAMALDELTDEQDGDEAAPADPDRE